MFSDFKSSFPQVTIFSLSQIPINNLSLDDGANIENYNRMATLVESMLDLNKELQEAKTPDEKVVLERQIAATDREIDELVYELYGLTEEERKIVEEARK